jgi:crotonobetainyl-CoA:carnitine CoA-transferase CaiB-like acyl-CoA transferase
MQRPVSHETLGQYNLVRSPINLSAFDQPASFDRPGPEAGEHNEEVLTEFGLSADEINSLRDSKVI